MTYGEIKFSLKQLFPGLSLDLVELFVTARYAEVLGELPWSRQNYQSMLQTRAPYSTGSIAVTEGSADVTLTGGAWTSDMIGCCIRAAGRQEFYGFTYLTPTTGTLDRGYEGSTSAAAGYSIWQSVYILPSDCRLLDNNAFTPLDRTTHSGIDLMDPFRQGLGRPAKWAGYMDDNSVPPFMQVEFFPVPDQVYGIPFTYSGDSSLASTDTAVQVWMQPSALLEGAIAKCKRHLKDYTGAQLAEVAAAAALKNMRTSEAQGMPPADMRLDSYYTRHRAKRWNR